jgi:tetratricopeptide (TPR) repeat protein
MGLCNYQLGLYEQAEEKYLEAISFDPELAYAI